jgi:hypothetical protein
MYRNAYVFGFLALALAGLGGCSNAPTANVSKQAAPAPDKIQGKALQNLAETSSIDTAMNAGGPSVYLLDGPHRNRLFFKTATEVVADQEYIAEGVNAQKLIDEIGDPDEGKNGYPLPSSCEKVVKKAWPGMAFDVTDLDSSVLCARVKRYPARPVFLVTRLTPVTPESGAAAKKKAGGEDIPEVSVAAEKQRAMLIEGPTVLAAPLWAPEGDTVHCKLVVDQDGKVSELETGGQLCESVPWSQFRYKATVEGGKPVKVNTEVEVRFEPRKKSADAAPGSHPPS